ncbi:MAG TPA: hypothetical protein VFI52_17185, partial [Gemmatimonadaceae bacterium]|nr:hypothetical protein [Gemmatimonadaceae bacterium]
MRRPSPVRAGRVALAFAVSAFSPAVLHAQRAAVMGIVVDTTSTSPGRPLVGADVRLTRTDSSGVVLDTSIRRPSLRVDSVGTFAFRDLDAGVYRV